MLIPTLRLSHREGSWRPVPWTRVAPCWAERRLGVEGGTHPCHPQRISFRSRIPQFCLGTPRAGPFPLQVSDFSGETLGGESTVRWRVILQASAPSPLFPGSSHPPPTQRTSPWLLGMLEFTEHLLRAQRSGTHYTPGGSHSISKTTSDVAGVHPARRTEPRGPDLDGPPETRAAWVRAGRQGCSSAEGPKDRTLIWGGSWGGPGAKG